METATGQYFRQTLIDIYGRVGKKVIGIGITAALVSGVMTIYYIYIMAYCLLYLWEAFFGMAWMEGPEETLLTRAKEFYYGSILDFVEGKQGPSLGTDLQVAKDSLGHFHWPLFIAVVLAWVVVYACIRKGIEQSGKIAFVTVLTPYVLLGIFLIRFSSGYLESPALMASAWV